VEGGRYVRGLALFLEIIDDGRQYGPGIDFDRGAAFLAE
jgi:hypothetical protein